MMDMMPTDRRDDSPILLDRINMMNKMIDYFVSRRYGRFCV